MLRRPVACCCVEAATYDVGRVQLSERYRGDRDKGGAVRTRPWRAEAAFLPVCVRQRHLSLQPTMFDVPLRKSTFAV